MRLGIAESYEHEAAMILSIAFWSTSNTHISSHVIFVSERLHVASWSCVYAAWLVMYVVM